MSKNDTMKLISPGVYYWIVLLLLLLLTWSLSFVKLGDWTLPVHVGIAALMILLVVFQFMHMRQETILFIMTAVTGPLFAAAMFTLVFSDYLTRIPSDNPVCADCPLLPAVSP